MRVTTGQVASGTSSNGLTTVSRDKKNTGNSMAMGACTAPRSLSDVEIAERFAELLPELKTPL